MKPQTRLLIALLSFVALATVAGAAETLTLDLATLPPNQVVTFPGGANTYDTIELINVIPRYHYSVGISVEEIAIASLGFPGGGAPGNRAITPEAALDGGRGECEEDLEDLTAALDAVEAEKNVPGIGATAIAGANSGCRDEVKQLFEAETRRSIGRTIKVTQSETLTVVAARPGATFSLELSGTARGEWRTSYGFFFVPDNDERYFVEEEKGANGAPSKFFIRKQSDREEFDFVPTVVFTFFPNGAAQRESVIGFTGGLGYDLEKPFVFGGASWSYNENIILSGGFAFHRQARLIGKYKTDQDVGVKLEPDQLVEDTYGPNVYLGISFRFNEDIHALRNKATTAAEAQRLQAATLRANAAAAEEESKIRKAACLALADKTQADATTECANEQDTARRELCVAKAASAATAAKAACAVTELDRVKAAQDARKAKEDADKAERRVACEERVQAEFDAAMNHCAATDEQCKLDAKSRFKTEKEKCLDR